MQSKINKMLKKSIKKNYAKIKAISPVNPSILKDDEWRNENNWDKLYKKLTKAERAVNNNAK